MIWMVPAFAILGATLIERIRSTHTLVLTTVAASFAAFNLFLILSNEMDGLFTRSATHLAMTGELARQTDVTARPYTDMIAGYDRLDDVAAERDSVLYVGSDDSWMYPAWGSRFTRYVRAVAGAADAVEQVGSGTYRFVVIEESAEPGLRTATERAATARAYRVLQEGGARVILERPD
jgi:hypothetical protein